MGVPRAEMIPALTGLRAVAAAWVVFEHFRHPLFDLFPWAGRHLGPWAVSGYLAVDVFFVLSGFIISHTYADVLAEGGADDRRTFWVNRLARIYPVHLAMLLAVLALALAAAVAGADVNGSGRLGIVSFGANLALLQALPDMAVWNGPAWSISAEAAAYLAFPAMAGVLVRTSGRVAGALAVALVLFGAAALPAVVGTDPGGHVSFPTIVLRIVLEFTAGCLAWRAWRELGSPRSGDGDRLAVGAALVVVCSLAVLGDRPGWPFVLTPVLAAFVVGCATAAGRVGALLSTAALQWGGTVSYSLYMTHFVVLIVLQNVLAADGFADAALAVRLAVMAVYYLACLVAAWLCFRLVEEPCRRLLRRAAPNRRPVHR